MSFVKKPVYSAGLLFLLAMALAASFSAVASECYGKSPAYKVALLELYTSEGCSSCPPADHWLSNLGQGQFEKQQVVPLAMHVDYWNYLGWKDPFSSKQYSQRQRRLGAMNNLRTVYTPQFVLNGEDLRGWYKRNGTDGPIEKVNNERARASIEMTLEKKSASRLEVGTRIDLSAGQSADDYGLYLALFENDLVSVIPSGENTGKTLHHDYVVRQLIGPYTLTSQTGLLRESFTIDSTWQSQNLGVAAYIQNAKTGDLLQALMVKNCS